MQIIVGLGNPGKEHLGTRHNVGFFFVEEMVKHSDIAPSDKAIEFKANKKFNAEIAEIQINGEKLVFVKPQTFMNLSGQSVSAIVNFYKCELNDLIVVSDDVDLPVGMSRVRKGGQSGGHNGLQNIIDELGSDAFFRLRIGISRPVAEESNLDTKKYVLDKIGDRDLPLIKEITELSINYLLKFIGKKEEIQSHTLEIVSK